MKTQLKYQKEIEKLEKENKELRKSLLLRGQQVKIRDEQNFWDFACFNFEVHGVSVVPEEVIADDPYSWSLSQSIATHPSPT